MDTTEEKTGIATGEGAHGKAALTAQRNVREEDMDLVEQVNRCERGGNERHKRDSSESAENEGVHSSGPGEDEVAGAADQEAQPISLYADRAFRHIVERSRQSLQVGLGSSVERGVLEGMVEAQGNVHESAGFLRLDSRGHMDLSEISDTTIGTNAIPKDGSACEDELPEAASRARE